MKNLYEISNIYNVKLYEIKPGDSHCQAMGEDWFKDSSYIAGKDINLGLYEDEELKIISFFHELGHYLSPNIKHEHVYVVSKYEIEKIAWKIGLKTAKKYNYCFSLNSIRWAVERLHTYVGYEKREMTPEGFAKMKFDNKVWRTYL